MIARLGVGLVTGVAALAGSVGAGPAGAEGTYGWTFNGRDADGWLLWWNGAAKRVTGSVAVS